MAFCKKHQNFINFLIVLVSGVFWKATRWEWQHPFLFAWSYLFYPLMWLLIIGGLVKFLKEQWRRGQIKTFVISLLCLSVLLLPFTRWYETARFWLLKNQMEAVAIQYAKENREYIAEHGYAYVTMPTSKRYLSRVDGSIWYWDKDGKIEAVFDFIKNDIGSDWELRYNTGLSSDFVPFYPSIIPNTPEYNTTCITEDWKLKEIPVDWKQKELGG